MIHDISTPLSIYLTFIDISYFSDSELTFFFFFLKLNLMSEMSKSTECDSSEVMRMQAHSAESP